MGTHRSPRNRDKWQAKNAQHIDKMMRQLLAAKQLRAPTIAGGDKLRVARRMMAMA